MTNATLKHRTKLSVCACLLVCGWLGLASGPLCTAVPAADALRAYAEGQTPRDARLGALKDLNGYFPFNPPRTRADWDRRHSALKRRILVSTRLWPQPAAHPAESGDLRTQPASRFHRRESVFRKSPRPLCDRSTVSARRSQRFPASRSPLSARSRRPPSGLWSRQNGGLDQVRGRKI